ncbi:Glycoside-Pentoside-Hexuronide:Cation Symporter (MFS) [Blattamonas nauphoetae]|uniref:Glycoside-Pentoside-Hexuronide:Cation Symporter (MFS) n=1 Tax=Blattamonas nauphoetae TaxID=2049346 RepID=A0ABQ9YHK5_9EUKA|nr:Glycoside-Pentoside-Hexuronide:Cation Symporter (MFS) [Blattamonas nauphoetae]
MSDLVLLEDKPHTPTWRLFMACMSYMAVQVAYSFAFAMFSPMMRGYGVAGWINPLIWLFGPIVGLFQPFIGVFSDNCTLRLGRRRPFILIGLIFVSMAYVVYILLNLKVFKNTTLCIVLAIIAFVVINVAINILMLPARAIVFDLAGPGQEKIGNNFISLIIGVGNCISFLCTAFIPDKALYFVGMGLMIIVTIPTFLFAKETPYVRTPGSKLPNPFKITFKALGKILKGGPVLRAAVVFLLSWFAYFNWNSSATDFVNQAVYKISTDETTTSNSASFFGGIMDVFQKQVMFPGQFSGAGIVSSVLELKSDNPGLFTSNKVTMTDKEKAKLMGNLAMVGNSLVTALFSAISAPFQKRVGLRSTYFLSQLLATVSLFCLFLPGNIDTDYLWVIILTYACVGANQSVFNSVPFAIVNESVPSAEAGMYAGVMNWFCLLGQTLSQVMCMIIQLFIKEEKANRHPLQWTYLALCIVSIIATFATLLLKRGVRMGTPENDDVFSINKTGDEKEKLSGLV